VTSVHEVLAAAAALENKAASGETLLRLLANSPLKNIHATLKNRVNTCVQKNYPDKAL